LEGGGISTVCYGLAAALSQRKIHSTVFTEKTQIQSHPLGKYEKVYKLSRLNIPPRFFWFQAQNYRKFPRLFKDCTIIHGVYPDASTFVPINNDSQNKPFVVSFHSEPFSCLKSFVHSPKSTWTPPELAHYLLEYPILEFNIKRCISRANHIFVCSYSALAEFLSINRNLDLNRVSVIYNGVNLKYFEDNPVTYVEPNNLKLRILFAGRLYWQKGGMFLLKAFEKISKQFNVVLDIYGKGPEEKKMKDFVLLKKLSDIVIFHGRISNKDLISKMKQADLVVSPSLREAQSMFVLEAMACRKPVITFDIPSSREIIKNGYNGMLAKVFDIDDLYEKMYYVLSDRKLRLKLGENAFKYVEKNHNWDIQIEKYIRVYENLRV
jgi:glycosyltransferase involved in cell wall biosynthesis